VLFPLSVFWVLCWALFWVLFSLSTFLSAFLSTTNTTQGTSEPYSIFGSKCVCYFAGGEGGEEGQADEGRHFVEDSRIVKIQIIHLRSHPLHFSYLWCWLGVFWWPLLSNDEERWISLQGHWSLQVCSKLIWCIVDRFTINFFLEFPKMPGNFMLHFDR